MMIFLAIVRRCRCEVCSKTFDLKDGEPAPQHCPHCRSRVWLWGSEDRHIRAIRQGRKKKVVVLNPGAKSRKRQEQGRRQWRQFKPKPVDTPEITSYDVGKSTTVDRREYE